MAAGPKVSLEALVENEIQEILYDGTEKTVPPLSMSDNLVKLAQMVDFGKTVDKASKAGQDCGAKKKTEIAQNKPWPWEWLRASLLASLTEMNVLYDVLNIAKEKKLMVMDQISNESTESKTSFLLIAHKQALQSAGDILMKGAERLKAVQQEALLKSQQQQLDFHTELWQLRQNWRIKKVGQNVLGDLSYKSAGSSFWQSGSFEVYKRANPTPGSSTLDVRVPPELQGSAYIQVSIHMTTEDDSVTKLEAMLTVPQVLPNNHNDTWQDKLEMAQNVLYCKELFAQITREAFQLDPSIPHMIVNNQVIVHLFPDFKMHIMFCHSETKDKVAEGVEPVSDRTLQLALHLLLREQHYNALHREPPHPVSAAIGPSKKRRIAGPEATAASELLDSKQSEVEKILQRMVSIGRHVVLRLRVMETIEHLSQTISDPLLQAHTDGLSDELHTGIKISITSAGFDHIRSSFLLRIVEGAVVAVGKSGHQVKLSHELQQIEDYLLWQIVQYQIQAVQTLARMMGGHVLCCSYSSNSADVEVVGSSPSILISSKNGDRALAVRGNAISGVEVLFSQAGGVPHHVSSLATDSQWKLLRGSFKQVDLCSMSGRNFTHKMEILLAVLINKRTET